MEVSNQTMYTLERLLESTEILRRLYPNTYDDTSKKVQQMIRKTMVANKMDVLPAALMLMEIAKKNGNESHIFWFAAAATDMLAGQHPHKSLKTLIKETFDFL